MSDRIRIAHFSDTHLGYRGLTKVHPETGRNQRTMDVDAAFTRTIDDILRRHVDAVIHSGDVFHHTRPTWHSLRHFIRQMRRLEDAGIPTLVIAGNHDTPRMRTGGSAYSVLELALPKIRFVADYEDDHVLDASFDALNLHIHAIPHGALTNPDPVVFAIGHLANQFTGDVAQNRGVVSCRVFVELGEFAIHEVVDVRLSLALIRTQGEPLDPGLVLFK